MTKKNLKALAGAVALSAIVAGCATGPKPYDYTAFRAENPHSILVVPVMNNSTQVNAPDYFLSTVSRPFAERGYYVFPAHMVKRVLEENGLSDAALVHNADPRRLASLFGCESVLLVTIDRWDAQYLVIATTTTVKFEYELKSCRTGQTLWHRAQEMQYTPTASTGNPIADLIADAVIAAIEKAHPNYMPLTQQANALASSTAGTGVPAGPYSADYQKDRSAFPSN
jgi:hypothetical protein